MYVHVCVYVCIALYVYEHAYICTYVCPHYLAECNHLIVTIAQGFSYMLHAFPTSM